jgi:hypothetical protein
MKKFDPTAILHWFSPADDGGAPVDDEPAPVRRFDLDRRDFDDLDLDPRDSDVRRRHRVSSEIRSS